MTAMSQISYTPSQAAAVTGRTRTRIFKAIKDQEIIARKDGKATLIEADELRRWVSSLPSRQPQAA
jgi:excisionase family DNA binding protein